VDEALFMRDRVVMMTNGTRARVGAIFSLPFERPRVRADVLDHPEYYEYRRKMIQFLEEQDHRKLKADAEAREQAKKQDEAEEQQVAEAV
ncbi:MAG: ABC transporter ATP-binding protein, partial [Rhodopirellula sp. JB053]